MKRDNKKALYESIMTSVAREVKNVLNEDIHPHKSRQYYINLLDELTFILEELNMKVKFKPALTLPNDPTPGYEFSEIHLINWDPEEYGGDLKEKDENGYNYSVEAGESTELNTLALEILCKNLKQYIQTKISKDVVESLYKIYFS